MIIVVGWLYVTVLVAASEPNLVAGIVSFLFYGALPCGLILYFAGSKVRRQRRAFLEQQRLAASGQPDQADHAPGDAVAAEGKVALTVGEGAGTAAEHAADAGRR